MLNKIRSKYIIKAIASNLNTRLYLDLFKYNKKLKKKLEITKKDFKIYNQIEIDIIPIELEKERKNTIVNYFFDEKAYYHLFLDDKELKRRNYFKKKDNAKKIKVIIDMEIKSLKRLFDGCRYIKEINFVKFNRKNILDMSYMFRDCENLININLNNFKTCNVVRMNHMFANSFFLNQLNVSSFDTSHVETMEFMFYSCCRLQKLDLSNFNTSKVTNMSQMFYSCTILKDLNVSNFNTSKVNEMSYMFYCCTNMTSLDLSNFNTGHVYIMTNMFSYCYSLINLDISNFYIDDNTDVKDMFLSCKEDLIEKVKSQNARLKANAFQCKKTKNNYLF